MVKCTTRAKMAFCPSHARMTLRVAHGWDFTAVVASNCGCLGQGGYGDLKDAENDLLGLRLGVALVPCSTTSCWCELGRRHTAKNQIQED